MSGAGLQGAPSGGCGSHRAGSRDGSPPAASPRRRLARRPGYMRSAAGSGTRVLSPAVSTPPRDLGGVSREELRHSEPRAGQCSLDQSGQWPGPLGSSVPKSSRAPAVSPAGHLGPALTSAGGTPVCFGIQPRPGRRFPERPARLSDPADAGGQQESFSMDGSAAPGAGQDASLSAGAGGAGAPGRLGAVAGSGGSRSLGRGLAAPQASPGSHETFTSSFSFIRLSLGSAGERGEAEGCLPSREAETSPQSPQEIGARATNPDGPHEDPQGLSQPFCLPAAWGVADSAQGAGRSSRPECGVLPSLDVDAGCSSSPDPSLTGCGGNEGSGSGDAHGWDALLQRWEPVLRDRLLSTRRQLEVASLRSKLQKLQEAAVEEEDYDKAEVLKQRLEDLEQEAGGLQLALPSRQPALRSFLSHLAAQAQAALRGAPQASGDDTQAPRSGEPATPGGLHVTAMRWDRLLGERQQLQKEMAALQARMSVLAAQEQRLSRELEEQERRGLWQGCGLTGPTGQLQAISKALQDTLAAASQLHAQVEPPEAITSLQERIKSLNLSLKEVTNEVCTRESLCSSLRRRVSHLETRLPALREARVLAVSGGHFCTAKDLAEEIRALGCELEGLEAALGRLLVLGSGSVGKLGRLREDQDRLRRELARQAAAHEASVKEKAVKYVEVLEENLRSVNIPGCLFLTRLGIQTRGPSGPRWLVEMLLAFLGPLSFPRGGTASAGRAPGLPARLLLPLLPPGALRGLSQLHTTGPQSVQGFLLLGVKCLLWNLPRLRTPAQGARTVLSGCRGLPSRVACLVQEQVLRDQKPMRVWMVE
ncbi:disrupted in schizophrenia 1 protein isoform X4 [Sciurus carolinensis]|uniref:disrupted in schizophrenia 1 protein isoform X4 n=1 Tax=Sciurus carolinensis TaxID=30640 RepID=UPI001FB48CF1|nr:disrupted in schizophrenia 1 protein isoform X4 [Sciurus carolinensis]